MPSVELIGYRSDAILSPCVRNSYVVSRSDLKIDVTFSPRVRDSYAASRIALRNDVSFSPRMRDSCPENDDTFSF